jgi:stearoyl-CoA desaturase (delta-9 desaturase)
VENNIKIDWVNTLFLTLTPIAALALTIFHFTVDGFMPSLFIAAFLMTIMCGMSITMGYHRLYSHKSYDASFIVKFVLLLFGAAAFQNSLLKWASDHRVHHKFCDTEKDPYNINKGFFWAHMGWILFKVPSNFEDEFPMSKDLLKDPLVMWQHKYYLPIAISVGILLPGLIGHMFGSVLGGLAVVGFARIVFVHHSTFFINSLCHMVGKTTYSESHTAKDSPIMALFTFGEGYHNFHHTFQADYRNGVKWHHFDPGKWAIWSLEKVGLARKLKRIPQKTLDAAEVAMKERIYNSDILSEKKFA